MNQTKIAYSEDLRDRFLSRRRIVALFCAVAFYAIGFLLLAPSIGSVAITLAIAPVIVIGWLWGWRAATLAGLVTVPLDILFLYLAGFDGIELVDDLADVLEIVAVVVVGGLIGFSRDLNMRANQEILARQRAEAELRSHRDHLEQAVETRTVELKMVNEQLQQALEKQRDLNELKSRFIRMVSHEYRSPLTSILSGVGLLRRYGNKITEAEKATIFQRIEDTVEHMTQLMDDVLNFNKFEEETGEVTLVQMNAMVLCQAAIEQARAVFRVSQTFSLSSKATESQVMVNSDLLQQALLNLLSNAVRYSAPDSTIFVEIDRLSEQILISIRDEGLGIPTEEQTHIFEPFYRAQNVENIPGTGLGLVISKQTIERQGGTLTFESIPNEGATFTISLPALR